MIVCFEQLNNVMCLFILTALRFAFRMKYEKGSVDCWPSANSQLTLKLYESLPVSSRGS